MIWPALGAAAGLPAGTVLRGQVYRLSVRGGEPEQAACGECAAPLPWRPALMCGQCGSWLGAPLAIELTAAAVTALLLGRLGTQPAVAALAWLGVLGVALAQVDAAVQRLPDRLTLAAYPALLVLLATAAAITGDPAAFVRAVSGGLVLGGGFLLLRLVSAGQLGRGDVKLAGLTGLDLGWLSWHAVLAGGCLGFLLAALVSLPLLARRSVSGRATISFGPCILAGALLAVMAAGP